MKRKIIFWIFSLIVLAVKGAPADVVWRTPSSNSSGSMPVGGGSIGMNVWVENGDILFYLCRSGSFDELNTLLKQGRFRIKLDPGIHIDKFRQTLHVNDGYLTITDGEALVTIWADVYHPVAHVEVHGKKNLRVEMIYENWRYFDRPIRQSESFQTSYKFGVPEGTKTLCDTVDAGKSSITFFHHNADSTVFDATVRQQGLLAVKPQMYNPLGGLIFGGKLSGADLVFKGTSKGKYQSTDYQAWHYTTGKPGRDFHFQIALATLQGSKAAWLDELNHTEHDVNLAKDRKASRRWWNAYWQRSFIESDGESAEYARNYTLFRYMMGCNAMSTWPTKFNGGLFCFDPILVGQDFPFTPDYRRWGGGTHTAQNQRLLYWPMLKSGDEDIMRQQLDFYRRILHNAELRSQVYWHHNGACFTEQIENFGLPEYDEYGKARPSYFDKGLQYNAWLEYTWDTVLEFCEMAFEANRYTGMDIAEYIPLVRSSLDFFDEHYRYLARMRGIRETDEHGKLILYPGSGAETFKMAYNSTSTIAGLMTVTSHLIDYEKKHGGDTTSIAEEERFLMSLPPLNYREVDGHQVLSPAVVWSRINGTESTHLYPVFPWRIYGVGRPNLDVALNTWKYDPYVQKFKGYVSWEQTNIWAACLGQTDVAAEYLKYKLSDGPYRFTAFWGPGHDWTPDHNWGGSGQIGLQEMLMQEAEGNIYLFPAWPKQWNVHFKLHASGNTTVEATWEGGKMVKLDVTPKSREKDIRVGL